MKVVSTTSLIASWKSIQFYRFLLFIVLTIFLESKNETQKKLQYYPSVSIPGYYLLDCINGVLMKEPTIFRNYLVEMTSLFLRQNGVEIGENAKFVDLGLFGSSSANFFLELLWSYECQWFDVWAQHGPIL